MQDKKNKKIKKNFKLKNPILSNWFAQVVIVKGYCISIRVFLDSLTIFSHRSKKSGMWQNQIKQ